MLPLIEGGGTEVYRQLTQMLTAARLISRPQGATLKQLEENIGVTVRTVYRILEGLEELGYVMYDEFNGRERCIKLNEDREMLKWWVPVPKVQLTFEDGVMLEYLFREVAKAPALAKVASELRQKLASVFADAGYCLADKERGAGTAIKKAPVLLHAVPVKKKMQSGDAEIVKTLLRAIQEKTVCLISYTAMATGTVKTYKIHPLAVFEHEGGVYAFVLVPYYGSIRILSIERFSSVDLTEESFKPPKDFDAEKRLSDPFGIILEDPFIARIWFSASQAPYVEEREWPSDSLIEKKDDGSIILNLETAGTYELKKWVMSFGRDAELLEPVRLRKEIAAEMKAALERYGDGK